MCKKFICSALVLAVVIFSIGCATIVSGRMQQLPVISSPSGATVTMGSVRQTTPATFLLDRRMGVYEIFIEKEGYEPVTVVIKKGLNCWVFGNIIFGGIIGLIVDIASGSASAFTPSEVEVNLVKERLGSHLNGKDMLFVKLKEEVK